MIPELNCNIRTCYNYTDNTTNYPSHCRVGGIIIDIKDPSEFTGEDKAECTSFKVKKSAYKNYTPEEE